MRKSYTVKKVNFAEVDKEGFWENIPAAELSERPWKEYEYHPEVNAKLVMSEKGFHLLMVAKETFLRTQMDKLNDAVCTDSCMEFFFIPAPEKNKSYINIEMNAKGVYHIGMGEGRSNRWFPDVKLNDMMNIKAGTESGDFECSEKEQLWWVRYDLPFEYITEVFGEDEYPSGKVMRGNFYKCGDHTGHPHYAVWSNIELPHPDYHCPELFGELVIE